MNFALHPSYGPRLFTFYYKWTLRAPIWNQSLHFDTDIISSYLPKG